MRLSVCVLLISCPLFCLAAPHSEAALVAPVGGVAGAVEAGAEGPIFGRKKTSNKRQRKFARKRSRRNGIGVTRARKAGDKRRTRGGGGGRGAKKKAGCNT